MPTCLAALQAEGASRDLLLLDIALDGYFRLLVERMDKGAMQGELVGWGREFGMLGGLLG